MTSTTDNLYVTYVGVDRDLLKIWGQRNRIGATYIERQLLQMLPQFNRSLSPDPSQIHKGMFCFAKYTDDNYYRARVISRVQGDSVGVLFIDYGNRDVIKLSSIRIQQGSEGDVLAKMSEQAEEYYLADVRAPPTGWTKEIVSKIRRDICYEEFLYQVVAAVGDQKILKIQFHSEDYSSYLVKKQLANPLSLPDQRQMILSYCSLVSNDGKTEIAFMDSPRVTFSPSVPPPNIKTSFSPSNPPNGGIMHLNYGKTNNAVNFSQPPPNLQYSSPRNMSTAFQQINSNIPKSSFFPHGSHLNSDTNANATLSQSINPVLNPIINHQLNPLHMMKENTNPFNANSNIIQILAQQVKQYIAEDNAQAESKAESIPHHYVNSVLEVGNTYNVIVSFIDDGPWSFSIQLLSSETELQKLMDELSSTELVPIKPPIILGHSCIASSALYGNLCRGVVVSISHSAVKVYFVDFGNTEDLPSSSIYELPQKFFKIRVLSQKFSLSGLQKVVYSEDIKKFFKEVVQDEFLMLRVTSLEDDNLPTCELYLKDKNIKRILNEKIREMRSSILEDFPKVGDIENVIVTWVVSPQKFFIQLHKRDADLKALKNELDEVSTKGQRLTYQQLSVGFKCVCFYESDEHWYRAVITSVDSENAITVFYVDYGNTETVKISHLRRMDSSALINQMSNQAIQCSLQGFENRPFDPELSKTLESLILEKDLQMSIVSSEKELLSVQLFQHGQDVSTMLLQAMPKKIDSLDTSSQNKDDVWNSPMTSETSLPSTFGKEKQLPEKTESYEKKDRIFRAEKTRPEMKGTWRNDKDRENRWNENKSDGQSSWQPRGGFKPKKDNDDWNINKNSKFGGNRGARPDKGRYDQIESVKFERNRGFNNARFGDFSGDRKDRNSFVDKQTVEENRYGRERFDEKKFNADEGKYLNRIRGDGDPRKKVDRNISPLNDKPKKLRKPIRTEDAAPPGSKFEERILELGSSERGIVTYYFSPHEFYVQLLAEEEEFKKMMKDIQTYYSDKYSVRDPVQAGDIVIAQFSLDKVLYRAEIVKPSPVTVRYIDYGNQEPVGPKGTWLVDKQFLKLPKQVIKCRLSNVLPIGSDWPPPGSAIDKFFEFPEYKCTFLNVEGDMYEISMEDIISGKDIAGEIIAAGLGRPNAPKLDVPPIDYSLLPNQVLRLYLSHVESSSEFYVVINPKASEVIENELKKFIKNKNNLIPLGKSSIKSEMPCLATNDGLSWHRGIIIDADENKILVRFSDIGESTEITPDKLMTLPDNLKILQPQAVRCSLHGVSSVENEENFKKEVEHKNYFVSVISCTGDRLSVVLYNENGEKLDYHKYDNSPSSIEPIGQLPIISQELPVIISHLETPNEIYVQCIADAEELGNFSDILSNFYSETKEDINIEGKETLGQLVAAKSAVYNNWYRGRLLGVSEAGLEIFYIDYGNKEILSRENVKKLDPSFWSVSAFCAKSALDVEYSIDKTEEIITFLELYLDKNFVAYFKKIDGNLICDFVCNGERITDLMKSASLVSGKQEGKLFETVIRKNEEEETGSLHATSGNKTQESSQDCLKVFVRHIDSPNQFWVQKESTINDLQELQDNLQNCCESFPNKESVQLNDIVAAIFCDTWYRAKVMDVDDDNVTVQFIDYGNTIVLSLSSNTIKELTEEFIKVPAFATPFALKGTWSNSSTTKFEEIILQDEDPVGVVTLEESEPTVVDLLQKGVSVTEMLIDGADGEEEQKGSECFAVCITHSNSPYDFYIQRESCTSALDTLNERLSDTSGFDSPTAVKENEIYAAKFLEDGGWYRARVIKKEGDDIQVHFIDYGNTSHVTEVKCLPTDLTVIPNLVENCCLLLGRNSDSWSEAACEKFAEYADGRELEMKVSVCGINKSVVELFHDAKSITDELEALCESDGRSEVYVTHALSPTDFYIQYVDDEEYKLITDELENCEKEDLRDTLPGTLCQACFVDDGCWYRAKILQTLDEGFEVFFIDFGNISVATELKSMPSELEKIAPKALRCSLNLPESNIPETAKEEFINVTTGVSSVFRAKVIVPGDVNIVSLKLNGRILEETLNLGSIQDGVHVNENMSDSVESETDDGKNSKMFLMSDNYLGMNTEDSVRSKESDVNETDEEKRVKIAISGVDGFKSDDEKNIEGALPSGYVNATDSELMEEALEDYERRNGPEMNSQDFMVQDVPEDVEKTFKEPVISESGSATTGDAVLKKFQKHQGHASNPRKCVKNKAAKIVPGCISFGGEELGDDYVPVYRKKNFSEKLVPGSISRGISLESVTWEDEAVEESKVQVSQSAPTSPKLHRHSSKNSYVKIDPNDRLVPGCISTGVLLHCNPVVEKIPRMDKIVPGAVNGSVKDS